MKYSFFLLIIIFFYRHVFCQSFTISDVIISDTTSSLPDPEIDWIGNHFCWANEAGIWVGNIDKETGNFIPQNGKGFLIDSTPSYRGMQLVVNGPEWAMSKNGSIIIYPDSVDSKNICVGTSKKINGTWVTSKLPNSSYRIPFFGSYDEDYIKDGITCASYDSVTMQRTGVRLRNSSDTTEIIPPPMSGNRWIKGFYGVSQSNENQPPYEIGYFNANTSVYKKVATFTTPIDQAWMVPLPEYNNAYAMWCVEKKQDQDEISIFFQIQNEWRKIDSIKIPSDRKEIHSPEPFWWNGKSYIFLLARRRTGQPNSLYDQVWIVGMERGNHFYRMVSEQTPANRNDPEVFYTNKEPVIYYTEKRNGINIIHKCSTGLPKYEKAPFHQMVFQKDHFPGTFDINGRYLGSTETMTIVQHKRKLFAGMGNWMDYPWLQTTEGSQILRKDSYNSPWVVDTSFGYRSMRTEAVLSVHFNKDYQGNILNPPVNLLVCGAGDISVDRPREVNIWVRDDTLSVWRKNTAFTVPNNISTGIRSFYIHTDKVTNKQWLFAGMSEGSIIKAQFNPFKDGWLQIDTTHELRGLGRVMAMTECNGDLYAAAGVDVVGSDTVGGLFRRIDGKNPQWQLVYRWPYIQTTTGDEKNIMRGITCVPHPNNPGQQIIIGTRASSGVVETIDSDNNVNTEFYIRDFFSAQWDTTYNGVALSAYNYFMPDTVDGKEVWWQSLWVEHPRNFMHPYNGSHFLVRYKDGSYKYGDIFDNNNPVPSGKNLRACRTICKSPFPEESYTYYFGGFDCAKDTSKNTSWIYKGVITGLTSLEQKNSIGPSEFILHQNYPNPFNPSTIISYQISAYCHVSLKVYDVLGREVATLADEYKQPGVYNFQFSIMNYELPSGIYFYQLKAGSFVQTKKMMVIK